MSTQASPSTGSAELSWFKSSYSGGEGGECVEVAHSPSRVHVRDSKKLQGPHINMAPAGWSCFVRFAAQS
ncbi:DUF397 domain-containing protein [Streptomyces lunaelactis]|uniref:DUF397 domain-containing protein n=1 Tax=Streptomyces lunaelactis TaxID=1535768 RepID=A0A2R4TB81_9ACTN|nr:DUF397 domain-containing protein [Streptomyces lunaelactis]AVZ76344.1 DUF397 domain-containing protein [Streptomyces lunaelactis]NUK85300.1 DUF397 domain-containing protein [Streptomyces lunaelactis]